MKAHTIKRPFVTIGRQPYLLWSYNALISNRKDQNRVSLTEWFGNTQIVTQPHEVECINNIHFDNRTGTWRHNVGLLRLIILTEKFYYNNF